MFLKKFILFNVWIYSVRCILQNTTAVQLYDKEFRAWIVDKSCFTKTMICRNQSEVEIMRKKLKEAHGTLDGRAITVAVFSAPPHIVYDDDTEDSPIDGMTIELFLTVIHYSGLKFKFIRVPENLFAYGSFNNGSWTGLIKMLLNKEFDMAIVPMGTTPERCSAVDFSWSVIDITTGVTIQIPDLSRSDEYNFITFTEPFSLSVWMVTLCGMLAGKLFAIIGKIVRIQIMSKKNKQETNSSWISELIIYTSYNLIVIIVWSLYVSKLMSLFTITIFPYNKIDDLMKDVNYRIGITKDTKTLEFFKFSKVGIFPDVWKRIKSNPDNLVRNTKEGMMKMWNEKKFAFIVDTEESEAILNYSCSAMVVPEKYFPMSLYMTFQKKFPYIPIFNYYIGKIRESGIMQRLRSTHIPSQGMSCLEGPNEKAVNLNKTIGAFIALSFGIFLSIITLFIERAYHHLCGDRLTFRKHFSENGVSLLKEKHF